MRASPDDHARWGRAGRRGGTHLTRPSGPRGRAGAARGSLTGVTIGSPRRTTPNADSNAVTPVTTPGMVPRSPVTASPCTAVTTPHPTRDVVATPNRPVTRPTHVAASTSGLGR